MTRAEAELALTCAGYTLMLWPGVFLRKIEGSLHSVGRRTQVPALPAKEKTRRDQLTRLR